MKKCCLLMLCLVCLLFAACGNENTSVELNDELVLGEWGENQSLSIEEQADGSVLVLDEAGNTVLDVTDYPRTDLLGDAFTGEPRLIKTYTLVGTAGVASESYFSMDHNIYAYDYYDTFGNLLVGQSSVNLVVLRGYYGGAMDHTGKTSFYYLKDGMNIGNVEGFSFTSAGLAASFSGKMTFYDFEGEEICSEDGIYFYGCPDHFVRTVGMDAHRYVLNGDEGWFDGYDSFYDSIMDTWGTVSPYPTDGEILTSEEASAYPREHFYNRLEKARSVPLLVGEHLIFRKEGNLESPCGIINDRGEILFDAEYCGFAYWDFHLIAFGEDKTEFYPFWDLTTPVKTLPYKMYCYDGKNGVILADDGLCYLTDGEGNILSSGYERIAYFDILHEKAYFGGYFNDSADVDMMDGNAEVLFTVHHHPNITYLGEGTFAVESFAANYTVDTTGKVMDVITVWDGYEYDESAGNFVYTGAKPEVQEP